MYEKFEEAKTYKTNSKKLYEYKKKKLQEEYGKKLAEIEDEEAKTWEFVEEVEKELGYSIDIT